MIFHKLNKESIVQVNDMTRLDAGSSFASQDEGNVTLVRISPDNGVTWFDVTNASNSTQRWYLDWAYDTDGDKTIKVEITTDTTPATEKDFTLPIISEADDCLFSSDEDLAKFEPEIFCYLRRGRSSYLDIHRCAQKIILDYLNLNIEIRECDDINQVARKLTAKDLFDKQEVNTWSVYQTLVLIFQGLSNQTDDIFSQKAQSYSQLMNSARNRAEVTVDYDQDGTADKKERLRTSRLRR